MQNHLPQRNLSRPNRDELLRVLSEKPKLASDSRLAVAANPASNRCGDIRVLPNQVDVMRRVLFVSAFALVAAFGVKVFATATYDYKPGELLVVEGGKSPDKNSRSFRAKTRRNTLASTCWTRGQRKSSARWKRSRPIWTARQMPIARIGRRIRNTSVFLAQRSAHARKRDLSN